MENLHAIMIGDVVGDPGLEVLGSKLPSIIKEYSADFVIVNGENAAGGFGLTAPHLEKIFAAGADVVTGGNHIWEKREFWTVLDAEKRVLRPMNYAPGSPGSGWVKLEKPSPWGGPPIAWYALNLQGREYMPSLDCPFRTFDAFDAARRFDLASLTEHTVEPKGCNCGEILRGIMPPSECPLFGGLCTPAHPVGPCMVSSEGSCAAYFRYY